jgi:hypothetical protein
VTAIRSANADDREEDTMTTYGTVAVGTLKPGVSSEAVIAAGRHWLSERAPSVPGFVDDLVLVGDDGRTIVTVTRFESKADYEKLAEDPDQPRWHDEHLAPLFDRGLRWFDGTISASTEGLR